MDILINCKDCKIKSKATGTLNKNELEFLAKNCAEVIVERGEHIIKQGQLSSHIAYIKSGLVKIHMKGPKEIDQILRIAMPGTYIGIQTILTNRIHQYSASALEDSKVCFIDINSFKELIAKNSMFANELLLYVCSDELVYFHRIVNHSQKQVNGRMAETLLFFADEVYKKEQYDLPLSRNDLAAIICTTRESATRSLKELNDMNIVNVKGKRIKIVDRKFLDKISLKG